MFIIVHKRLQPARRVVVFVLPRIDKALHKASVCFGALEKDEEWMETEGKKISNDSFNIFI